MDMFRMGRVVLAVASLAAATLSVTVVVGPAGAATDVVATAHLSPTGIGDLATGTGTADLSWALSADGSSVTLTGSYPGLSSPATALYFGPGASESFAASISGGTSGRIGPNTYLSSALDYGAYDYLAAKIQTPANYVEIGGYIVTPPTLTGPTTLSLQVGSATADKFTALGSYPGPTVTITSGSLPSGVSLISTPNNVSASITGTPTAGTEGTYPITLTAADGLGSDATLSVTVVVGPAGAATDVVATAESAPEKDSSAPGQAILDGPTSGDSMLTSPEPAPVAITAADAVHAIPVLASPAIASRSITHAVGIATTIRSNDRGVVTVFRTLRSISGRATIVAKLALPHSETEAARVHLDNKGRLSWKLTGLPPGTWKLTLSVGGTVVERDRVVVPSPLQSR